MRDGLLALPRVDEQLHETDVAGGISRSNEHRRLQVRQSILGLGDIRELAIELGPVDLVAEEGNGHGCRQAHVDRPAQHRAREETLRLQLASEVPEDDARALFVVDALLDEIEQGRLVAPVGQLAARARRFVLRYELRRLRRPAQPLLPEDDPLRERTARCVAAGREHPPHDDRRGRRRGRDLVASLRAVSILHRVVVPGSRSRLPEPSGCTVREARVRGRRGRNRHHELRGLSRDAAAARAELHSGAETLIDRRRCGGESCGLLLVIHRDGLGGRRTGGRHRRRRRHRGGRRARIVLHRLGGGALALRASGGNGRQRGQERREELVLLLLVLDRCEPHAAQPRAPPRQALPRVGLLALQREDARVRGHQPVLDAEVQHLRPVVVGPNTAAEEAPHVLGGPEPRNERRRLTRLERERVLLVDGLRHAGDAPVDLHRPRQLVVRAREQLELLATRELARRRVEGLVEARAEIHLELGDRGRLDGRREPERLTGRLVELVDPEVLAAARARELLE